MTTATANYATLSVERSKEMNKRAKSRALMQTGIFRTKFGDPIDNYETMAVLHTWASKDSEKSSLLREKTFHTPPSALKENLEKIFKSNTY